VDGPEEFHVILLDNGRIDMLAKGYGEALCCIRCGACLNVCPVYREIGGHAYGSTYSGPIGAVISPLLHTAVTDVDALPYASSLCGACRDACPAKIDLPKLLLDLRRDVVEAGDTARLERMGMQGFLWAMGSRARYEALGGAASFGSNLLAWLSGGQIKALPGPFHGWTDSRNFPPFARRPFREQFAERQNRRKRIENPQ
jgi:L-lactate dehydrogenase complex protein LldF